MDELQAPGETLEERKIWGSLLPSFPATLHRWPFIAQHPPIGTVIQDLSQPTGKRSLQEQHRTSHWETQVLTYGVDV